MRISDGSSDVCSSDLGEQPDPDPRGLQEGGLLRPGPRHGRRRGAARSRSRVGAARRGDRLGGQGAVTARPGDLRPDRSEERRVGQEGVRKCISGWLPYHNKKNKKEYSENENKM